MKKVAFSVLATGSIALFIGAGGADASSYKVQSGDSLWKIANENNISLTNLKQFNNLTSDTIYTNQVLQVAPTASSVPATNQSVKNSGSVPSVSGTTYTVKPGDTLSRIAGQHKTTVEAIQNLNGISDHLIYSGQKLNINGAAQAPSAPPQPSTPTVNSQKTASVVSTNGSYKVVSGDTLTGVAYRHGISVTQLTNWNNLTSSTIRVGQILKIENAGVDTQPNAKSVIPSATTTAVGQASTSTVQNVITTAMPLQGTPYIFGGATTRGFDCSGFIHYVYSKAGVSVPRTNAVGLDARSYEVDKPQLGDLVFFKNTYKDGISHVGIYIGDNKFIHAGGSKVTVDSLSSTYWSKHFDSFKRFYAMD